MLRLKKVKKKFTYILSDLDFFRFLGQKDKYMTDIGEAVSSIILMLELSVYMQNSSAFDALCNGPTPRVVCTPLTCFRAHNVFSLFSLIVIVSARIAVKRMHALHLQLLGKLEEI